MLHINFLDLVSFPCISKRHCSVARQKDGLTNDGDNAFLGKQKGLSYNIRHDFNNTHHGIARKDVNVIAAPPVMQFPPVFPERDVVANEGGRGGRG